MRFLKISSAIALISLSLKGQNLVKNPGFEDTVGCPTGFSMSNLAKEWDACGAPTPDFFYDCPMAGTVVGVPLNTVGFQNGNGKGYGGIHCYESQGSIYREYLVTKLKMPLVTGQTYHVRFKVSRADDTLFLFPSGILNASSNKIGARFRKSACPIYAPPNPYYFPYPDNFAHVYTNNVISDFVNWTVVQGSFVADSAYEYLVIGNFFDMSHTTAIFKPGWGSVSYYYIDDVCVSSTSGDCILLTGVQENKSTVAVISPNPVFDRITVAMEEIISAVTIKNLQGQIVAVTKQINARKIELDISGIEKGFYFLTIDLHNTSITKTFLKD